ncbi:hypothetical protein [Nonomuraea sp. NPDC048901]|uniref:hypothetical protein n=1 Tax=Nonomuraea sp. NPDC048901 TaxID=3155627 RepID=UPI0033D25837
MAAASCDIGHEGVDVRKSSTLWIISMMATALWVTTALAASVELTMHWYLALMLATAVASIGALIILNDNMTRARDAQKYEAGRASFDETVRVVCAAIGEHATRMEIATKGHGDRLRSDVLTAERLIASKWRGETIAQYDAAMEAARRHGSDTGPLPIISIGPS